MSSSRQRVPWVLLAMWLVGLLSLALFTYPYVRKNLKLQKSEGQEPKEIPYDIIGGRWPTQALIKAFRLDPQPISFDSNGVGHSFNTILATTNNLDWFEVEFTNNAWRPKRPWWHDSTRHPAWLQPGNVAWGEFIRAIGTNDNFDWRDFTNRNVWKLSNAFIYVFITGTNHDGSDLWMGCYYSNREDYLESTITNNHRQKLEIIFSGRP